MESQVSSIPLELPSSIGVLCQPDYKFGCHYPGYPRGRKGNTTHVTPRKAELQHNLKAEVKRLDALSEPEKFAIATMLQEAYTEDQKEYRISSLSCNGRLKKTMNGCHCQEILEWPRNHRIAGYAAETGITSFTIATRNGGHTGGRV